MNKTLLVVGATSGMAEHCSRLWLQSGTVDRLILVARNEAKLSRVARDLQVRAPSAEIVTCVFDRFNDPIAIRDLIADLVSKSTIEIALVAHGTLPEQSDCQFNLAEANEALLINGVSPVLFAESLSNHMERQGKGTLVILSSVAGDRGRKSNYTYGAAKGLVTRYIQGLQHRFAGTDIKIILVKPGPTETPMTAHLSGSIKMASVESVAKTIVEGSEKGKLVIYSPVKWGFIMMIIRHLPQFLFRRMDI